MAIYLIIILTCAAGAANAISVHSHSHHSHPSRRVVPAGAWHHDEIHPVHALFKRAHVSESGKKGQGSDGGTVTMITTDKKHYPVVGSSVWKNAYPPDYGDFYAKKMPRAWTDALDAAIAAGKIPNIPIATNSSTTGEPTYGKGTEPAQADICSSTAQCRIEGDIWDAPAGVIGIGFDDGPLPASNDLYTFLRDQNQTATHFFIGSNILDNHKEFLTAFKNGNDIAVHTWSHPLMTTKTNKEVLAELGWTLQIIHDSTGGRVPKYWRPPYGDSDRRVHAIAKEVFGLTGILWNHDTFDWSLTEGGTTPAKIASQFDDWLNGSKSPGLIILEHELSSQSVAAFMKAFPLFATTGWKPISQARMLSTTPYQNAEPGKNGSIHAANVYHGFKKLKGSLGVQPAPTALGLVVDPSSSSSGVLSASVPALASSSVSKTFISTLVHNSLTLGTTALATPLSADQNTSSGHAQYPLSGLRFWQDQLYISLGVLLMKYLLRHSL